MKIIEGARRVLTPLAAGISAFACSALILRPRRALELWGVTYSEMSVEPLSFEGPFPHRLLSPLLAHLVQLTGDRFFVFPLVVSIALLSVVYLYCRRNGATAVDAYLVTLAVAATAPVLNTNLWPGYTDTSTYLLLVLTVMAVRMKHLFWFLFVLNTFNHEQILFLAPWLVYLRCSHGGGRLKEEIGLGALYLLPYVLFRFALPATTEQEPLDVAYYADYLLEMKHVTGRALGLLPGFFATFGFLWTLLFWRLSDRSDRMSVSLYAAGLLPMLIIAHDINRVFSLFFMMIVLVSLRFLASSEQRVAYLFMLFFTAILPYKPFVGNWIESGGKYYSLLGDRLMSGIWLWNLISAVLIAVCVIAGVHFEAIRARWLSR